MRKKDVGRKVMWVLKSLLISYVVTLILLMILALLLYKLDIGEGLVSAGIVSIYVISTLAGGILIGKMARNKRFIWGIGLGMGYFLILFLITLAVYRTINTDVLNVITTWILCTCGGMIGGMMS